MTPTAKSILQGVGLVAAGFIAFLLGKKLLRPDRQLAYTATPGGGTGSDGGTPHRSRSRSDDAEDAPADDAPTVSHSDAMRSVQTHLVAIRNLVLARVQRQQRDAGAQYTSRGIVDPQSSIPTTRTNGTYETMTNVLWRFVDGWLRDNGGDRLGVDGPGVGGPQEYQAVNARNAERVLELAAQLDEVEREFRRGGTVLNAIARSLWQG